MERDPSGDAAPDLPERFAVRGVLGSGAFGRVLRARDGRLGRDVAVKVLDTRLDAAQARARFEREARVTARLGHPNIVEVHDHGVTRSGTPYIVYDFVEGRTLEELVDSRAEVPEARAVRWGAAVARALGVMHEAELVHRDVKPANVMVRADGEPVLLDLGIVHVAEGDTLLTAEGVILGTPGYMAPELWLGEPATAASDQYAWAATLFELLYHRPVQPMGELRKMLTWAADRERPRIPRGFEGRAPEVEGALLRALAPHAAERFPDMEGFADALEGRASPREGGQEVADATVVLGDPDEVDTTADPAGDAPEGRVVPAESGAPSAPVQPAGRVGVVLALLVAVTGVGLLARAEREAPPGSVPPAPAEVAPSEAEDDPVVAQARRRERERRVVLERAVSDLAATHRSATLVDGLPLLSQQTRQARILQEFPGRFTPEMEDAVYRFGIASAEWVRSWRELVEADAATPELDAVGRALLLGSAAHVLDDIGFLHMKALEEAFLVSEARDYRPLVYGGVVESMRLFIEEVERWQERRPPVVLAAYASYVASLEGLGDTSRALAQLDRVIDGHHPPEDAYWLERAGLELMRVDSRGRRGRCEPMMARERSIHRRALGARRDLPAERRLDIVVRYCMEKVRSLAYCGSRVLERDRSDLLDGLQVLRVAAATLPDQVREFVGRAELTLDNAIHWNVSTLDVDPEEVERTREDLATLMRQVAEDARTRKDHEAFRGMLREVVSGR